METHKVISRTKDIGSNKSLLDKGLVPGIVYGKGTEPTKIAFEDQALKKLIQSKGFYTKILNININGKTETVLPKILQFHPVTDKIIHFDLLRVKENTKVTVEVPVEFLNQDICPGLKQGGPMEQPTPGLAEIEREFQRFPAAVGQEFTQAATTLGNALSSNELQAWAAEGLAIAQQTARSWEAAAEYFRATGARCSALDSVDKIVTCVDVHAGIAVGQGGLLFAHGK